MANLTYFCIYKPFGVLSQFTREAPHHQTLADLYPFPPDVYPVGRLDKESEGLLILTNDASLNQALLHPSRAHRRTYLVQVEGVPDSDALRKLRRGVTIRVNRKPYQTRPCQVRILDPEPDLPDRDPPIRFRKNVPTSWLEVILTEGKNRQVRRMGAAVGYPVLRLVRSRIEALSLPAGGPGAVEVWEAARLKKKLRL